MTLSMKKRQPTRSFQAFRAMAFVCASAVMVACLGCSHQREIEAFADYPNSLSVGYLSLEYPDDMKPIAANETDGLFAGMTLGGALVDEAQGVRDERNGSVFTVSAVDNERTVPFESVNGVMRELAARVGASEDGSPPRIAASIERVTVNGIDALVFDTTTQGMGFSGEEETQRLIVYSLFVDGALVGEVSGYFAGDAYADEGETYDGVFSTIRFCDSRMQSGCEAHGESTREMRPI